MDFRKLSADAHRRGSINFLIVCPLSEFWAWGRSVRNGCNAAVLDVTEFIADFVFSDISRFMVEELKKLHLLLKFVWRVTLYPFLLIMGVLRRMLRRTKAVWMPKGPGRQPVREDVVELILDMKRSNLSWGVLRISQELLLLGIRIHKKP